MHLGVYARVAACNLGDLITGPLLGEDELGSEDKEGKKKSQICGREQKFSAGSSEGASAAGTTSISTAGIWVSLWKEGFVLSPVPTRPHRLTEVKT